MHVSAIDTPSDQYGAVSDVARPLVYKLNQASMQRSTFEALHALLVWALATLEGPMAEGLAAHEGHIGVVPAIQAPAEENQPPESTQGARSDVPEGDSGPEEIKSLVAPANVTAADAVPLSLDLLEESAEDSALEAQAAEVVVPPEAPAEVVPAETAPVAGAPTKRVAKPK